VDKCVSGGEHLEAVKTSEPFLVMAKPVGPVCNLDCDYCYYLDKQSMYPKGQTRMSRSVLKAYLTQTIGAQPDGQLTIAYQGGEPTLMGLNFFRRAVETAKGIARPGQMIEHTIQTNGTLLDQEWGAFLREHDFLVGLSVDGPPDLHDVFRKDKRGRPSFSQVMNGLEILKDHHVRYNILCTVNSANAVSPLEVYRFLRDQCQGSYLQLIPIVEVDLNGGVSTRSVTPQLWGSFLTEIFDEWFRHDIGRVFVQPFEATLASWLGIDSPICVFSESCGRAVALEHNGDLYSCDHFVDNKHRLGNILSESISDLIESSVQIEFGKSKSASLPTECLTCDFLFACHGECPKNRVIPSEEGSMSNYLCTGYRHYFETVDGPMRMLAQLIRAGKYADEVYKEFSTMDPRLPCPCGSGRQAGDCHALS